MESVISKNGAISCDNFDENIEKIEIIFDSYLETRLNFPEVLAAIQQLNSLLLDPKFTEYFLEILSNDQYQLLRKLSQIFEIQITKVLEDQSDHEISLFIKQCLKFWHNFLNLHYNHHDCQLPLTDDKFGFWKHYKCLLNLYLLDNKDDDNEKSEHVYKQCSRLFTAILHLCIVHVKNISGKFFLTEKFDDIWEPLLNHIEQEISEWSLWIIYLGLQKHPEFPWRIYSRCPVDKRALLLDVFMGYIDDKLEKCKLKPSESENSYLDQKNETIEGIFEEKFIKFMVEEFKNQLRQTLQEGLEESVRTPERKLSTQVAAKMSFFLQKISSFESINHVLKNDQELFQLLMDMMKAFRFLAETKPETDFGIKSRLASNSAGDDGDVNNPLYGYKRNIIGLMANILYGNRAAQDQLRESDSLISLLDCAQIDRNNPFIMQSCIFAIRNALKDNLENQEIVRNLQKHDPSMPDPIDSI